MSSKKMQLSRRDLMKYGAAAGAAGVFGKAFGQTCVEPPPVDINEVTFTGCGPNEAFPVSPFILNPFTDPLPVPTALRTGYRRPDGTLAPAGATDAWSVRQKHGVFGPDTSVPGPGLGDQDSMGDRDANNAALGLPRKGTHQLYPGGLGVSYANLSGTAKAVFDALPTSPLLYHIRLQLAQHRVTNSAVQNINLAGQTIPLPPGANAVVVNRRQNTFLLPFSTRYNFNGSFPGPLVNSEYGRPLIIRFENDLDQNPLCLDRQDFGAPDWAFLTHLHNGHTAPESDGNPNHMTDNDGGYQPGQWVDNLYLQYPAGGDDREKQSFLWFHDHRMHHTGPNVYKGMVGLMPHYDPILDSGDERTGLRLPGVRTNNPDGTFDVKYDVPLALYDCCMDDGVTPHQDEHQPAAVCGLTHPEWWGKLFLQHYPNHGFVGDVFTVNGTAYPVLNVERRKYRFRFLGASLARCYNLSLRQGALVQARGRQGQWTFGVARAGLVGFNLGTQVMRMTQIANEGGLLPTAFETDTVQVWPAKRREVIVDFTKYMDGSPTKRGDVIYLTNTMEMLNGRKPDNQFGFAVPMLKFVIGALPAVPDQSLMPVPGVTPLRASPPFPATGLGSGTRTFTLSRGGGVPVPGQTGTETQWLINGLEFNPIAPLAVMKVNSFETWNVNNGGGGWVHPMHLHQEEHHILGRTGTDAPLGGVPAPDFVDPRNDTGKEDVIALAGTEQTTLYRGFRTYCGNYVAHCHNLAHEDHNMMFGWVIAP